MQKLFSFSSEYLFTESAMPFLARYFGSLSKIDQPVFTSYLFRDKEWCIKRMMIYRIVVYRQLSADIEIKNIRLKPVLFGPNA